MSVLAAVPGEAGKLLSAFVDTVDATLRRSRSRTRWLVVDNSENGLAVFQVSSGKVTAFGDAADLSDAQRKTFLKGARRGVELRLSPERMIAATLKVPAGARQFAGQIVEHRLEKLTPWRSDKVLYGYAVGPKPGADGQHDVQVAATSREIVSAALSRLEALGVEPCALGSAAEPLERPLGIDLLGGRADGARLRRRRRIAFAAPAFLVASAALFGWSQWVLSEAAFRQAELEARLAEVRQKLVSGSGTDAARQEDLALLQSKTPQGAVFLLIDRLATAIPDDTVLDGLEIASGSVRLSGSSADASALVGILEADANLSDAAFEAPVTRQLDGRDRFDIVLARRQETAKAAE